MTRIIITIVVVVLLVVGFFWVWNHFHGSVFGDGAVTTGNSSTSSSDQSAMNSGVTTDPDGNAAHPTPSRSDAPGTINGDPIGSTGTATSTGSSSAPTMGTPMAANTPAPAPSPVSAPGGLTAQSGRTPVLGPGTPVPLGDTVAPNPPNHVGFGGTGKYMWYRQGDLTWRVNSDTGASCIAFATMQEWARPIVYQNGCDSRRS